MAKKRRPGRDKGTGLKNVELDSIKSIARRNGLGERWIKEAIAAKKGGRTYIKSDGTIQVLPQRVSKSTGKTAADRMKKAIADKEKHQAKIKKAQKARVAEKKKAKASYNKKQNAAEIRQKTLDDIAEINPHFKDPDKLYTQAQLDTRLERLVSLKDDLITIKQENPAEWKKLLTSPGGVRAATVRKTADFYIGQGAGDPNAVVSDRKGLRGRLETELPDKLNSPERDSIWGKSGSVVRREIETDRAGSKQSTHATKWNKSVNEAAEKLDSQGFFPPGDSDVKIPPRYTAPNSQGKFLSNKDLWIAERTLDYGHLGSASNPSFHYVINYDSNGQPEFTRWNMETSASMTPTEYVTANERIQSGRGYEWDRANRGRFNRHLDELMDILSDAEFNELSTTLEYFDSVPDSPFHIDDAQRDYVRTNSGNMPNKDIDAAYQLTNNRNNFTIDKHTQSALVAERQAALTARIALLKGLPSVDLEAALQQGLLAPGTAKRLDIDVSSGAAQVELLTDEELMDFHKATTRVLREGENLTVDQVLRRAIQRMPRVPVTLAAMLSSIGSAFASSPADETKIEAIMSGLENYDRDVTAPGGEALMGAADKIGVGKYVASADEAITSGLERGKSGEYGTQNAIGSHVADFFYNALKYIPAEVAGIGILGAAGSEAGAGSDVPQTYPPRLTPEQETLPGPPVPYHRNEDGYYEVDAEQTLPGPAVPYHWNEGGYYEVDGISAGKVTGLPPNVLAIQPKPKPWKKYGGALQSRY